MQEMMQKAEILIQSKRYTQAAGLLEKVINQFPDNPYVLGRYAQVLIELEKKDEGLAVINNAIALAPEEDFLYYIKGYGLIGKESYREAETSLREAIELNPEGSMYFSMLGHLMLVRRRFDEALEYADESLELDPENTQGLNVRSTALLKLDRKEDAATAIEGALNEDPNNPYTHANYGWGLLEQGKHKESLTHFAEALKLDPNFEFAQQGMMEALKAKYVVYRWFLKYAFAMGNLTAQYQWGIIIGFYLLTNFLDKLSRTVEWLRPFLSPIVFIFILIAFSTWVITPLSNLFLRLNPYGKHLLRKDQMQSSTLVGISLLICILGGLSYLLFQNDAWLSVAGVGFAMMVPLSLAFSPSKYKNGFLYYAIGLAGIGLLAIVTSFSNGEAFNGFTTIFIFGFIAYQWIANYLRSDF